jgi:outer membrane lipoprotein-sorting protein
MNDLPHPCERWAEPISLAAAGCLPAGEEREVRRHIETCSDCRERFRQLEQLCGSLAELRLPATGAETTIVERVMAAVTLAASRRSVARRWIPRVFARAPAEKTLAVPPTRSLVDWRWIMRHPVSSFAAAAVLALAVGAVALWFHGGGTTPAFADFIQPILDAKTVTFNMTLQGERQTRVTAKVMVMAPNRLRMEQETDQEIPNKIKDQKTRDKMKAVRIKVTMVSIMDGDTGKNLMLLPAQKVAVIMTYTNVPKEKGRTGGHTVLFLELRSQLADARNRPDWIREPLGEKEIDGRRLVGFRLTGHGMICDLWGDPRTGMPVRIESSAPSNPSLKPIIYSDFVLNAPLDESLFSLEPPAGYKVQKQSVDASPAEEKDLIETFRRYGQLRGGALPDQLDLGALSQLYLENWVRSHPIKGGFPSEQDMQEQLSGLQKFTRGLSFAFEQLPREADAHYAGKGVKLGAAGTPIFWYRPKDAQKYRVMYADLSVREADAAPRVPHAQPVVSASGPKK